MWLVRRPVYVDCNKLCALNVNPRRPRGTLIDSFVDFSARVFSFDNGADRVKIVCMHEI